MKSEGMKSEKYKNLRAFGVNSKSKSYFSFFTRSFFTRSFFTFHFSLFILFLLWLLTFALGKLVFIAICRGSEAVSGADVAAIWWHGLPMDLSTASYLLLPTWLCFWVASTWPALWRYLRWFLLVFHAIAAFAIVACIVGDIALYPFWNFKLDATIWTYIDSPRDAVASVSTTFVLLHLAAFVLASLGLFFCCRFILQIRPTSGTGIFLYRLGPEPIYESALSNIGSSPSLYKKMHFPIFLRHFCFALLGVLLFITLRGGVTESTMNVGNAYFSDRQFLNHAAVNPAFSLLASSEKVERFDLLYRAMTDEAGFCEKHIKDL